jgi:prepilin-type N-terminal cleavage/methylation domain-containing protein/prepilin-type processing-associated H-X9-DG protein
VAFDPLLGKLTSILGVYFVLQSKFIEVTPLPAQNQIDRSRMGFTLTELLIVVAVIAVLAAILLPVFSQVREKARAAACMSNYHQIGLAIHIYATDYDDHTPPNGGSFSGIVADCDPYTHSTKIFVCPDDYDRVTEGRASSYRMASLYQGLPLSCGWKDPYIPTQTAEPASTTLAYEAEQDFAQSPIVPTYRHNGGTQVMMFDGHVKWVKGISQDTDD